MTMEEAAADGGTFTLARPEEVLHRARPVGVPERYWCFEEALTETVPRVGVLELEQRAGAAAASVVITAAESLAVGAVLVLRHHQAAPAPDVPAPVPAGPGGGRRAGSGC